MVAEVESALQQCDGAWWQQALSSAAAVRDAVDEARASK